MKPDGNSREGRAMNAKKNGNRDEAARIRDGVGAFFKRHPRAFGEGIAVAYSGGADSTVLLAALASLKPGKIRAVHVSHGLRPADELRAERAIVEGTCRGLKVPLTVATIKPGKIERLAREKEIGIEAAARELRYRILGATARRFGLRTICTAHNANDQLETLLARCGALEMACSSPGRCSSPRARRLSAAPRRKGCGIRPIRRTPRIATRGTGFGTSSFRCSIESSAAGAAARLEAPKSSWLIERRCASF
jgi:tRNA(Ile)-lysidine synthetase-like protein